MVIRGWQGELAGDKLAYRAHWGLRVAQQPSYGLQGQPAVRLAQLDKQPSRFRVADDTPLPQINVTASLESDHERW